MFKCIYVLEIEQRLFKPLAVNHQALYFVNYFFDKICDIEIVIIILLSKVANFRKIYKFKINDSCNIVMVLYI